MAPVVKESSNMYCNSHTNLGICHHKRGIYDYLVVFDFSLVEVEYSKEHWFCKQCTTPNTITSAQALSILAMHENDYTGKIPTQIGLPLRLIFER